MALDLAEEFKDARLVLEESSEALSMNVSKLLGESSVDELRHPAAAQVALVAHALAAAAVLRSEGGIDAASRETSLVDSVLGHSVGEISACAAAGALSLPDALRLARIRGLAMDWSGSLAGEEPLMLALMGCTSDAAAAAVERHIAGAAGHRRPRVAVANINAPGQVVLSGDETAVRAVEAVLRDQGNCRRAIPLTVGAAFHSPHMATGVAALRLLLSPLPPRSCLDPSSKTEPLGGDGGVAWVADRPVASAAIESADGAAEESADAAERVRMGALAETEAASARLAAAEARRAGVEGEAAATTVSRGQQRQRQEEEEEGAEAEDREDEADRAALLGRLFAARPQARALSADGGRPVVFGAPAVPVVTNSRAEVVWPRAAGAEAALADRLVRQSAGTVQWEACVGEALGLAGRGGAEGGAWLELGPGSTLSGLVRRCLGKEGPECRGVGSAADMIAFLRQRRW